MSRSVGILGWRRSFRHRVVACVGVGLACQAALAPVAIASTMPGAGADRAPPSHNTTASVGTTANGAVATPAGAPSKDSKARPDNSVPELWKPHVAVVVDASPPLGAESLFDGDATTGLTAEKGTSVAVRLELGSAREVLGLGVHGAGRSKIAIYAEDGGARRLIKTGRDGAIDLASDHWAQLIPAQSAKTSALVVQWTAAPTARAAITELALWVAGSPRSALAEAAIADRLVTELPENAVAATAIPRTASVARITPQGPVSASFTVKVSGEPRLGRAFLVYELEKKAHWTGVPRSINGHVVRGGYRAEARGLGGVQVEEINPTWLTNGDNKIVFAPTPGEDGLGYNISNVRIVSVPRGVDAAPAPAARSALTDGDLATGVGGPGVHAASMSMPAERAPAFLSFYLDQPTGGTLTASTDGGRGRKGKVQLDLDGRPAGWQTVPIAGVLPASGELRVRVQGDRESKAQVSEARIVAFPALASQAELAVSYPLHGECDNHKTYVRGFVSGPGGLPKPQLFLDGQPTTGKIDPDGSLEIEVKEPAAANGKPWSVRLEVATEGGGRLARTVPVDTCVEPPKKRVLGVSPPVEDVGAPYGAVVSPHKASTLDFAGATLEIPVGAVDSDVRVTMRALDRVQVKPVTAEMDNVSSGGGALRFGPHGLKFKKPVKVTLPIDPARMPPGMTPGDVQAFFFNEANGKWTELPKRQSLADRVVAQTTHFTDFIASTVKSPDHPDAQQFNPNSMQNLKLGEPGAGITLIEPPQANSRGSASISYPIETPPSRNGIGPSLALTYDSGAVTSNGWLGVGWDLKLPSIEIDARFGVPKYDGTTDIYSLDGAMLAPTATAGTYVRRVEGSFDTIKRVGSTATTYSWTVTDKNGTVYTYGTTANSRLANPLVSARAGQPAGVPMAPPGAIFRWYLEKVRDSFGNVMKITYVHDGFSMGTAPNDEKADEVYPTTIDYTSNETMSGTQVLAANYHVTFTLDTLPPSATPARPDIGVNARAGFVVSTRRLLKDVHVKMGTGAPATWSTIRHYRLEYQSNLTDTLQKSVLSAVALWSTDSNTSELYRHTFEYNKAPAATTMFSLPQTWGQVWQGQPGSYVPRSNDGLSQTTDNLGGGAVTLGYGWPFVSVSGSFGMDTGTTVPALALLPITGQGLPDQVDSSGTLSLNGLRLSPPQTNHFSPAAFAGVLQGGGLPTTDRSGWTAGGNVQAMNGAFGGGFSYARHVQTENKIITDLNGDGFTDFAQNNGSSIIGYINDGNRNFTQETWTGYNLQNSDFSTANRLTETPVTSGTFMVDPLIRWVAPFSGTVNVTSSVRQDNGTDPGHLVELYIGSDAVVTANLTGSTTVALAALTGKSITGGDKVWLRVASQGPNGESNGVRLPFSIAYNLPSGYTLPPGKTVSTVLEPTGRPIFVFDGGPDGRLAGRPAVPWHLTSGGDIGVVRCFSKQATPDQVTVTYRLRNKDYSDDVAHGFPKSMLMPATSGQFCFPITLLPSNVPADTMVSKIVVTEDQSIGIEFTSDSPVDPAAVVPVDRNFTDVGLVTMGYLKYCRPTVANWVSTGELCGQPSAPASGTYTFTGDPWPKFRIPRSDITPGTPDLNSSRPVSYYQTHTWKNFQGTNINSTTTPTQPIRTVGAPSASVTFAGSISTNGTLAEDVLVLIQGVNKLFAKRRIPAGSNGTFTVNTLDCNVDTDCPSPRTCVPKVPTPPPPAAPKQCSTAGTTGANTVTSGEQIFFTIYSPTTSGINNVTWSPTMNSTALAAGNINKAIQDDKYDNALPAAANNSHDSMGGGFHRWFYGDWNHDVPFDRNINLRTTAIPQNNDAVIGGIGVETNDEDQYSGRGEALIILSSLYMTANAGRVSSQAAIAGSASNLQVLRTSDTWNLNLQTNIAGATAGLSGGDATTQVDFFDFNGDGYPDSITGWGVQLNNGPYGPNARTFAPRQRLDMGIGGNAEIRQIVNISLQAGVSASTGSRQVINESESDGMTKSIKASSSLSGSIDYGVSSTRIDFADVNGDGLVDHVRQLPNDATLKVRLNLGYGFSNEVPWTRNGWTVGDVQVGAGFPSIPGIPDPALALNAVSAVSITQRPSSTNVIRMQDTGTRGAQFGGNIGPVSGGGGPSYSVTRTWVDLVDVNGDGLPDQVLKKPGDPWLRVKLNKGDRFDDEKPWSLPPWQTSPSPDFSFLTPDGLSFSTNNGWGKNLSFQICFFLCFGASGFSSNSYGGPTVQLEDIDGDGDLDQVMKVPGDANIYVKFNKVVNGGESPGNVGPPNLLTAVNRPLGGRFEIVYQRSGNHVDLAAAPKVSMPSNQWAMSRVVQYSGFLKPWDQQTQTAFDYTNGTGYGTGYHDPVEKENLGYANVKTIFPIEDVGGTSIASVYSNQKYYLRGLETSKTWYQNDTTQVRQRTVENQYLDPTPGKNIDTEPPRTGTYFPANKETYTYFYEMGSSYKAHLQTRTFNTGGDLIDVIDTGDGEIDDVDADDFNYRIDYRTITTPMATTARVAEAITVRGGAVAGLGQTLAKRTAVFNTLNQPKPSSVTDAIIGGKDPDTGTDRTSAAPGNATWLFTYEYGNVATATSPNKTGTTDRDGNARVLEYTYDAATKTYPETTKWSDGTASKYTATTLYEPKFGLVKSTTDVTGAKQEIDYDAYGRVIKVWAPTNFQADGTRLEPTLNPTIVVTYSQFADTPESARPLPASSMVTHKTKTPNEGSLPPAAPASKLLRTVNFVDGLERSIQVKKDISRDDGSGTLTDGMSVSGNTIFDARGRVRQQGQPEFRPGLGDTSFVSVGMSKPTTFAYDVLGRLRQEQHLEDGSTATTNISYQLGTSPVNGRTYVVKMTADPMHSSDPNYHYRAEYRTARDKVEAVLEPNQINGSLWNNYTTYVYDRLGRVTRAIDPRGNPTVATWDSVGNLVKLNSPDAGAALNFPREWQYCLGGYVCAERSPRSTSTQLIKYTYDRDRLTKIDYPNPAANPPGTPLDPIGNPSVTYTYGAATLPKGVITTLGGAGFKAGRVTQRTDEAGTFTYDYDALGNTVSETAVLKRTGAADYPSYQTKYQWDNFGRLVDVTIPASLGAPAETIRYGYDSGGAVASARGLAVGNSTPFDYVKHVGYNEFGERVRITYGNDAYSDYAYVADNRRLYQANTWVQDTVGGNPRQVQGLYFYYDLVGNVTGRYQGLPLDDDASHPVPAGGYSSQGFSYDPLNQLTSATLFHRANSTEINYGSLSIAYDEVGSITQKNQTDSGEIYGYNQNGDLELQYTFAGGGYYSLTPAYNGTVAGVAPHAPSTIDVDRQGTISTRVLTYDRAGNVVKQVHDGIERQIRWTDGERIRSVCEGNTGTCGAKISEARYAADGTRTHNRVFDGSSSTETLYVNQYLTLRNGLLATKHVYLGDARVASKVESGASSNNTYWYHSDHLQSTQYVTTKGASGAPPGVVTASLEYFPAGEIFRERTASMPDTMDDIAHATTFTGKELDPRTGYYYFGARYYEPQMQMWLSPDPILNEYMLGNVNGGVFNTKNLGLYSYAYNNPVVLRDPDGRNPGVLVVMACAASPGCRNAAIALGGAILAAGAWATGAPQRAWDSITGPKTLAPPVPQNLESRSRQPKDEDFNQQADDKAKAAMAAAAAAAAASKDKDKRKDGDGVQKGDRAKASDTIDDVAQKQEEMKVQQGKIRQGKGGGIIDKLGKIDQRVNDMAKRVEPKNAPKPLPRK